MSVTNALLKRPRYKRGRGGDNDKFKKTFEFNQFESVKNRIAVTEEFIKLINTNKTDSLIDFSIVNKDSYHSLLEYIKQFQNNEAVEANNIIGIFFDKKSDDGEEVTVLYKLIEKEKHKELYTFYILNKSLKIIFIDFKSTKD